MGDFNFVVSGDSRLQGDGTQTYSQSHLADDFEKTCFLPTASLCHNFQTSCQGCRGLLHLFSERSRL